MLHDDDGRLRTAVIALAANPDNQGLQGALCAEVYTSLQPYLLQCVNRLLPWYLESEVEDILHSTLCAVFQKAIRLCQEKRFDTERGTGQLAAYLRTIARNELKDQVTKLAKSHQAWPLPLLMDVPTDPSSSALSLPEEVNTALGQLSAPEHQIVRMRLFEECSYAEIAERLGITREAAKMRFHRAVEHLRHLLPRQDE